MFHRELEEPYRQTRHRGPAAKPKLPPLRLGRRRALCIPIGLTLRSKADDDLRPLCRDRRTLLRCIDLCRNGRNPRETRARRRRASSRRRGAAVVWDGRGERHESGGIELRDRVLICVLLLILLLRLPLRERLGVEELRSLRDGSVR